MAPCEGGRDWRSLEAPPPFLVQVEENRGRTVRTTGREIVLRRVIPYAELGPECLGHSPVALRVRPPTSQPLLRGPKNSSCNGAGEEEGGGGGGGGVAGGIVAAVAVAVIADCVALRRGVVEDRQKYAPLLLLPLRPLVPVLSAARMLSRIVPVLVRPRAPSGRVSRRP